MSCDRVTKDMLSCAKSQKLQHQLSLGLKNKVLHLSLFVIMLLFCLWDRTWPLVTNRHVVSIKTKRQVCSFYLCAFLNRGAQPLICPAHCPPPALYLSAIRQIVAGLICIMSANVPIGAPHSCLLKDSGATAPSHSPIPWIKLTLGQHQHIMNYGHLPLQTHCSLCSSVKNIEGTGELSPLTAYSLSYLLCCVRL